MNAGLFGYDSYDECVVEEMRGQNNSMLLIVSEYCRSQFPVKDEQLSKYGYITVDVDQLKYKSYSGLPGIIHVTPSKDYIPVGAVVLYSPKECKDVTGNDTMYKSDEFKAEKVHEEMYRITDKKVHVFSDIKCQIVKSWRVIPR